MWSALECAFAAVDLLVSFVDWHVGIAGRWRWIQTDSASRASPLSKNPATAQEEAMAKPFYKLDDCLQPWST